MKHIIDVRTPAEFIDGHYSNAVNYELKILQSGIMPNIPLDDEIHVYCKRGIRAAQAQKILMKNGFTQVNNLGGYDPRLDIWE